MANKINVPVGADIGEFTTKMNQVGNTLDGVAKKSKTSLQTISGDLYRTRKEVENLTLSQGLNSQATQEAIAKYQGLKGQLDQVNTALGASAAPLSNVQSAASKLGGTYNMLGVSVNQLTREMPAFANSAQTGFMAISNNIPMLADAISNLRAQNAALVANGQQAIPIWQSLSGAIFSWNTAISLGITALTVFGPAIWDMVAGTDAAANSIAKATISLEDWNKQMDDYLRNEKERKIFSENEKADSYTKPLKLQLQLVEAQIKLRKNAGEIANQEDLKLAIELRQKIEAIEQKHQQNLVDIEEKANKKKKVKKEKETDYDFLQYYKRFYEVTNGRRELLPVSNFAPDKIGTKITASIDVATQNLTRFKEEIFRISDAIGGELENLALNGFGSFAEYIGMSLAGANVDFGEFARQMLGQIASTIGDGLIAIGAPLLVVNPAMAALYLGSGAALKAVAGALKAGSTGRGVVNSNTNSGYNSNNSYSGNVAPNYNPYATTVYIDGRIRGTDIVISSYNQDIKNRRVR